MKSTFSFNHGHAIYRTEKAQDDSQIHRQIVTLRIIWPNFLRAIWHIAAQFISDRSRGFPVPFRHSPQPVVSSIHRILDQCMLQEIKVSAGHSAERLRQISSKLLCQIIRKVTGKISLPKYYYT
jgi:hypothetical protein